jgi:hypothetical protein
MPIGIIPGIIQGAIGGAQAIIGGIQAHKAQKELGQLVNSYKPNESIMDYYTKALNKYNVNPYSSALYRMQMQNAGRGLTTGINALNDRRSVLGGIGSLVQGYNDAGLRAAATAEGQQSQALGQLGQATAMKAQEDFKPFEMKYNLLAMKAGGANQVANAGLQNAFGGLSNISNYYAAQQAYGGNNGYSGDGGGSYSPTYSQYKTGRRY